jgi:hypothetical protein
MPAQKAPKINATTLYFVVLMPIASAAISSSLIDMHARPCEELIKLVINKTVPAVKINNQSQFVYCTPINNPAAPFGFLKSIDILVIVVLGGLGSISGSILAAFLLAG